MKIHKAASMALALFALSSSIAFADQFSWFPHLMPNQPKDSDHRINLWGGALITIVNDSEDTHYYNLHVNLTSPDCITSDNHAHWEERLQVAPHSTYNGEKDLNVAIECNHGVRESKLDMHLRQNGKVVFEQTMTGLFTVR
jgi:hypothetical protein